MKLAILGSGFIARFYADALVAQRRKDVITMVYSRTEENAKKFAKDYNVPHYSISIKECVESEEVDAVIIALSNDKHLEAVLASAAAGNMFFAPSPWAAMPAKLCKCSRQLIRLMLLEATWKICAILQNF
jgi:Predicted dehydrogenases and related proteins